MLFGETTQRDRRSNNPVKDALKRFFVSQCDGFVPAGKAASEYYQYLGAPKEKIHIAPFCADHDFFKDAYKRLAQIKEELKHSKGFQGINILFSGRMVPIKGIHYLLRAFGELQRYVMDVNLILLGDGPYLNNYKQYSEEVCLKNVFFQGFIDQERLPEYYAMADVFVLPSISEPWGLVVNEAMAFGLPVICTDVAGVSYDLVRDGVNGYVVKPCDSQALISHLCELCSKPALRESMGRASRDMIKEYTPSNWAQKFSEAIRSINNSGLT